MREGRQPQSSHSSPEKFSVLEGLMVQLRRVGTNIHELARRSHAPESVDFGRGSDAEVRDMIREVRDTLDQIRSRLA